MNRFVAVSVVLLLPVVSGGCGTILSWKEPGIYSGVRKEIKVLRQKHRGWFPGMTRFAKVMAVIDLPLSFLADTVLLPVSIPIQIKRERERRANAEEMKP